VAAGRRPPAGRRQRLGPARPVPDPAEDRRLPALAELRGNGQTLRFRATDGLEVSGDERLLGHRLEHSRLAPA
jgi:hypothetical protein